MYAGEALVNVVSLDERGRQIAWLAAPPGLEPAAGQYLLVDDGAAACAQAVFCGQREDEVGLPALAPLPASWLPGQRLALRGPQGQGFSLPGHLRRLALVVYEDSPARLLRLAYQAQQAGAEVALFCEPPLPALPDWLEANPLSALPEALAWADFCALDLPGEALADLRRRLGLASPAHLPCPAQALVRLPMPCGGVAGCSACALPTTRGWKLACLDGPVFDLFQLEW